MIDIDLFKVDPEQSVIQMFKDLNNFLIENLSHHTIFVHNLGSFDGYFLFKYLTIIYPINKVKAIIENDNRFIQIKLNHIKFNDSFRIFSVSLNSLCEIFNKGEGKLSDYNPKYNTLEMFSDKILFDSFVKYANKDSIILYKCMLNASEIYFLEYGVELADCLSMSSLSILIFRKKFLKVKIPATR